MAGWQAVNSGAATGSAPTDRTFGGAQDVFTPKADTTMHRDPFTPHAAFQPRLSTADWGSWANEPAEANDGPGLLVSRMFWLGGGLSLLLWACATGSVLYFT
jgi:hypothetical protein